MKYTVKTSAALAALREPSNLLLAAKAATITVATITLYLQDLAMVFNDALKNEATSYILVVPLLLVYLMYRKRKTLRATMSTRPENQPKNTHHVPTLAGLLLCITAIILGWYGSSIFTSIEYHILTLPILTAGLTLILFNPQTLRQALFPIAFLAFLTPPPLEILYGLGSTLVFAAFVAFIVRDKLWKKAAIFMIGFPLIYVLNILRITIIAGIGYQFGEQLALDMFLLLGGWVLIFLGTLMLLTISERIFKIRLFNRKQENCLSCTTQFPSPSGNYCHACGRIARYPRANSKKTDIAKIVAVALTAILLLSIQSTVFPSTQSPPKILIDNQGNIKIFPNITGYTCQFYSLDHQENTSKIDFSLNFIYAPQEGTKERVSVNIQIADSMFDLYPWEYWWITIPQTQGEQPKVTQLELTDITILENPQIVARYFSFQQHSDNLIQLVLYWFQTSVFTINNTSQQKHVRISLITYPENPDSIPNIKSQLLPIAKAIADYRQPIKTSTNISMTVSEQGLQIATLTAALLIALSVFYILELKRQTTANANAFRNLPQQSQQLVDAIRETQRTTLPTINRIIDTYRTATGDAITEAQLEQRMIELEKTGVVTGQTVNNQDEPAHIWKTKTTFNLRNL